MVRSLRSHPTGRTLGAITVLALVAALPPTSAGAQTAGPPPNHRGVPNVACGPDTPVSDHTDRGSAARVHQRSIDCLDVHGITEGDDGRFLPSERVSRGQMASFLARMLEASGQRPLPADPPSAFADTEDDTHEHRIDQLAAIGVLRGRAGGAVFDPGSPVDRDAMASFIIRAVSWAHGHDYEPLDREAIAFGDVDPRSVHAPSIEVGHELWLFEGRAWGSYDPHGRVNRDAMATFLTRALDLVHVDGESRDVRTYELEPVERVSVPAGETVTVAVVGERTNPTDAGGAGPVSRPLMFTLLPCTSLVDEGPPATFVGDRVVADTPSTDRGTASFTSVNGLAVGEGRRLQVGEPVDGRIEVTVASPAGQPDCAVVFPYVPRPPFDDVPLDARGRPVDPHGYTVVSWE